MNLIRTTLTHKIHQPHKATSRKYPTLILLHGLGANEDDLFGLAKYFDDRLFIISARAPFQYQWSGGYTWYNLLELGKPEPNMFAESYQKLLQFIQDVKSGYTVDPDKIFLFGFSMGAMMSYAVVLTNPNLVKGVLANSGLIPEGTGLTYQWDKIRDKSFFVAHGIYDSIVPVMFAKRAKDLLEKAGADLTYREYEMDHQIDEESLNDNMKWLEKHL
jgi:phospholipase/carboxylesterase